MNVYEILDVKFHNLTMDETVAHVERVISTNSREAFAFSNPEFVVHARKNKFLKNYLNRFVSVNVADGVGVVWASRLLGHPLKERVTGTDFVPRLTALCADHGYTMYFLGGQPGVAEQARKLVTKNFHREVVVGCRDGFFSRNEVDNIIEEINKCRPNVLMVCLGNPNQENWIFEYFDKLNVNVVFGNGGALDFWSGHKKRAPITVQRLGLEWLYRLGQDFTWGRIRRQSKLVVFVGLVASALMKRGLSYLYPNKLV